MTRRSHSAQVLDEADKSERKLDWILFKIAQEKILYRSGPGQWKPGDFLVAHPWLRPVIVFYDENGREVDYGEPQSIRPMAQVMQDYAYAKCKDCQVSWGEGDDCWICGKTVITKSSKMITDIYAQAYANVREEMSSAWRRAFGAMLGIGEAAHRATGAMRGLRPRNVVLDETVGLDLQPIIWYAESDVDFTQAMFTQMWARANEEPVTPFHPARTVYEREDDKIDATASMLWAFRQRRVTEPVVEVGDAAWRQRAIERVSDGSGSGPSLTRSYDRRRDGR